MRRRPDHRGFEAFAETLSTLTRPILKRKGRIDATVLARWPEIVGTHLAAAVLPEKVTAERGGGVLVLRLTLSALATEIQHLSPVILERVNSVFGYSAVTRLRLLHGATCPAAPPASPPRVPPRPLSRDEEAALADHLRGVQDPALHQSLLSLGRAVLTKPEHEESERRTELPTGAPR
jgi:hypothetical protein